jgi:carbon monoxide dehydrogenase subunit G
MTTIESKIGTIKTNAGRVYERISDLSRLEGLKEQIPQDKVSDWEVTADTLSFTVAGMAKVNLRIVEREPDKTIKIAGDGAGMEFNFWIQLIQADENDTRVKLTFRSELNAMMKMMFEGKIKSGLDKMVEGFEKIQ